MKLKELFKSHINQQYPPKNVFCFFNKELKSIPIENIDEYDSIYYFKEFCIQTSELLKGKSKYLNFPVLSIRTVV